MDEKPRLEPDHIDNPEPVIEGMLQDLDALHRRLVDGAEQVGYARDVLQGIRPHIHTVLTSESGRIVWGRVGANSTESLVALRDEVHQLTTEIRPKLEGLASVAGTAYTMANSTGSIYDLLTTANSSDLPRYVPPAPPPALQKGAYADRFTTLEPALGKTYREIWQCVYGTTADPERAGLFLIRQAFDQLFGRLAPDDKVRKSPHWRRKPGDKPDAVFREERIHYAASLVRDGSRARTLVANSRNILSIYQELNAAHDRGQLDREAARGALRAMQSILHEWADALTL